MRCTWLLPFVAVPLLGAGPGTCAGDPPPPTPPATDRRPLGPTGCHFTAPEGWTALPPGPGEVAAFAEPYQRQHVIIRSRLTLREPHADNLANAVRAARAEEQTALGKKPSFELVRDGPMKSAKQANHLLVYRYRLVEGGPAVLRFHAVYSDGFRAAHAVADSQATAIDALELPYREAGLHEPQFRPALMSVECT